jgi:hypothetical protein
MWMLWLKNFGVRSNSANIKGPFTLAWKGTYTSPEVGGTVPVKVV